VLIRYKPTDWFDVRLAYTNTVSYPDYAALAPIIVVQTTAGTVQWNGNNLQPQRSTNYDAELSVYNNTIGLFTAGAFLKQITNLIYNTTIRLNTPAEVKQYWPAWDSAGITLKPGYQVTLYENNPYKANDFGMEFDWETHFWYLPGPLTGLVLDANFTHIFSKAQYPTIVNTGSSRAPHYTDTTFYAPLLYQPDDIANLTLGYDYRGFSLRVSYIYSSRIFTSVNQTPAIDGYTAKYNRWDIALKQDLPFPGVQVYCNLNDINSADELSVIASPYGFPLSDNKYDYTIELGLRLNFDGLFNHLIE